MRRLPDDGGRGPGSALRALRRPSYRWYWLSGLGMTGAQGITQLAVAWLVLDLTDSVGQLGIVIFMTGLPWAVVSLFGGVLADRYDRRWLLIRVQYLNVVSLFGLAALTLAGLVAVWQVYAAAVLLGASQALSMPARNALVRSLVTPDEMMNAVALNSMQMWTSRVLSPSLAGVLISVLGVGATLSVGGACSLAGILCLLPIGRVPAESNNGRRSALREIIEGVRFSFAAPRLQQVMIMNLALALFGLAYLTLGPGFARQVMGFNAEETGLFMMAAGIGAILGSLGLVAVEVKNHNRLFMLSLAGFAGSLIALAANGSPALAYLLMVAFGVSHSALNVTAQSIFQVYVPQQYLGRVISLWHLGGALGSVSALPIGLAGSFLGLRWALGGVAVVLLVATVWFGLIRSPLRRLQEAGHAEAAFEAEGSPASG